MKNGPDVSIIIGTYKTKNLTLKTLASLLKNIGKNNYEVIVIDDGSEDGTFELIKESYPQIKLFKNNENLGYSKTYNKGTKISKGRYVLHLNSDVLITKNSNINSMIGFMDKNPGIGIAGCRVLKKNGKLDLPCRHEIPSLGNVFFQMIGLYKFFPFFKKFNYYMTYLKETELTEVGGILGAFMFIRRDVINQIGYLDEKFFLYCEDTDYCYRAYKKGWKIYYYPKITVKHLHGASTRKFRLKALVLFHKGIRYFYSKHYSKKNGEFINHLVYWAILIRFLIFFCLEVITYLNSMFLEKKVQFSFDDEISA